MKKEKKNKIVQRLDFIKTFFIVMGVIFTVILITIVAIFIFIIVTKPMGIDITKLPAALTGSGSITESSYDHPLLDESQEILLENLGVDTTELPTSITPAMEECAVAALGQQRVDEIIAGSSIGPSDYLKAGNCF